MGMQILSTLDQSPASTNDVCILLTKQFQLPQDRNFLQQIIKTLHHLDELGLIEKAG